MARSKIYGAGGYTGQFLRDTAFSDEIGPGKFINRGLDADKSAPPPGPDILTPSFYASLINNTTAETYGDSELQATEQRNSKAMYTQRDVLYSAPENQIRQERLGVDGKTALGTLMEPAETNVSPQKAVFTHNNNIIVENGLPSALSADFLASYWKATPVDDVHLVAQSLVGLVSVNNTYSFSVFIKHTGEDAKAFRIKYQGGFAQARTELYYDFVNDVIDRVDTFGTDPATLLDHGVEKYTDGWRRVWFVITINFDPFPSPSANIYMAPLPDVSETSDSYDGAAGNFSVYATGLSIVEKNIVSSYIHGEEGSASSRAVDQCSWPITDSQQRNIFNQAQGMAAILWTPKFGTGELTSPPQSLRIVAFDDPIMYLQTQVAGPNQFRSRGNSATASVDIAGNLQANTEYLVLVRWDTNHEIGYKAGGAVTWGTPALKGDYRGSAMHLSEFTSNILLPVHAKSLYLWPEDKGQAWLENFFSGVAN